MECNRSTGNEARWQTYKIELGLKTNTIHHNVTLEAMEVSIFFQIYVWALGTQSITRNLQNPEGLVTFLSKPGVNKKQFTHLPVSKPALPVAPNVSYSLRRVSSLNTCNKPNHLFACMLSLWLIRTTWLLKIKRVVLVST